MKALLSILLAACMAFCFPAKVNAANDAAEITINTLNIAETGEAEIIGHVLNAKNDAQVTCLAVTEDGISTENYTSDTIIWIDQKTVGNNGAFLIRFHVNSKFSEKDAVFRFSSDAGTAPLSVNVALPQLPLDIECVANNSVIYGKDAYTADSIFLTSKYVTESIVNGGNVIYYKLGGAWYDLLNPEATSSAYLVKSNAENISDMKKLALRYYYNGTQKYRFGE